MVLTVDQLLGFGLAALILIAIPGPSVVFAISRAVLYSRRVALASVAGNAVGLFVVMTLVVLGLGLVVAQSLVLFTVLKYVGAAYLVWLGIHAFRHRRQLQVGDGSATESLRWQRALWQGVVVGVGNPKAFMIFAAVLPPFVASDRGAVALQMFLLGLLAVGIGLVCDSAWALVAGQARTWFAGSPRRAHALGAMGGSSMVALGVGMALTDSRD